MDVEDKDKWIKESKTEVDIKIVPWGRRVFGILDEFSTVSGIIQLPEKHSSTCRVGTVIAVGPECEFFRPGDRFMIKFMDGVQVHLPGHGVTSERFRIFHEGDFLCMIAEDDDRPPHVILKERLEENLEED